MSNQSTPVLFCIPYAGGNASIYYKWRKSLEGVVHIIPLEMRGHGRRLNEALYDNFDDGVEDLLQQIQDANIETSYSIFGHSLGGMLAYEVSRRLEGKKENIPQHVIISGCLPPNLFGTSRQKKVQEINDSSLLETIRNLGGTPEIILQDQELLSIFLPVIRNDFRLVEEYAFQETPSMGLPLSIYVGDADTPCDLDSIRGWYDFTESTQKNIKIFHGGHFFIHEDEEKVIQQILTEMKIQ
ncbi:thioesterase II family protein [Paenibacillus polysaccharolyticus]|uniref:thioesterase II family protein n=1 Tax=Paenibacillus polysaccharolyticus TaxID=582692 RepID=UPI0012B9F1F7|nr:MULTISPECIES: alpha/beta fold hydrolase [Paenibacillus]